MNRIVEKIASWFSPTETDSVRGDNLIMVGGGSRLSSADVMVNAHNSLAVAAYYACLRNISEDIARLPVAVYRPAGAGITRVQGSPVAALIGDCPNDEMTAMSFIQTLTAHALGWGNGYAEIVRDGRGNAVALYPIHPSMVKIRRDESGAVVYDVMATGAWNLPAGERTILPARDVLHIMGMSGDGLYGYSIAKWASETLGTSMAVQQAAGSFFGNGMQVSGILKHPEQLSKEAQERLVQSIEQRHSGSGGKNSFKVMVLEEGMEWHQTSIAPEQAQMLQTRQFLTQEIARWFRMPPSKIGDRTQSTYNNLEQESTAYVSDCLAPHVVRWEQEIRRKLITSPDERLRFDMGALQRGDLAARAAYYALMHGIGVLNANEIRLREGENPYEGGDEYYIPLNMAKAGEQPDDEREPEPAAPVPPAETPEPESDPEPEDAMPEATVKPKRKRVLKSKKLKPE